FGSEHPAYNIQNTETKHAAICPLFRIALWHSILIYALNRMPSGAVQYFKCRNRMNLPGCPSVATSVVLVVPQQRARHADLLTFVFLDRIDRPFSLPQKIRRHFRNES